MTPANLVALKKFYKVAVEYRDFIDGLKSRRPRHFYDQLFSLLARLLNTILLLQIDDYYYQIDDKKYRNKITYKHSDWKRVTKKLDRIFSGDPDRVSRYHQKNKDKEYAYRASIVSNDLAELYQDIKQGILFYEDATKESRAIASWEWRFDYEIHWGYHLLRAMTTIYEIQYYPLDD